VTPTAWTDLVASCRQYRTSRYLRLSLAGSTVGLARPEVAQVARTTAGFTCDDGMVNITAPMPRRKVSSALANLAQRLADAALIPALTGELYPLLPRAAGPDLGCVDRSASLALGIRTYGVHLNAYVRRGRTTAMWISRRAANRRYFPGLLDNLVAGGQPANLGTRENLLKEAAEEAGIGVDLMRAAAYGDTLSYRFDGPDGFVDSLTYAYDLELPASFQPVNQDGGIESFQLVPLDEVAELVRSRPSDFKFNAALTIMQFLLRHRAVRSEYLRELDAMRDHFRVPDEIEGAEASA
jgi:8-oxo-dGTP pyrophosphatase MutT (NUDIX family)